ncbi:MAG TPA: metallophosphoesterase [Armatimonadota bacterium]|nr:metallophosphoesterase [Armatimonadota bacterium]
MAIAYSKCRLLPWLLALTALFLPLFRGELRSGLSLDAQASRLGFLESTPVRPRTSAVLRVALVADTHCTRSPVGDRPKYRERFDRVIRDVNAANVDVVLVAGDLTNGGEVAQMRDFRAQARGFRAPIIVVPGNRDVGNRVGLSPRGQVSEARVAQYEHEMGPSFFVRKIAGLRVIGVNASLLGSALKPERRQWTFLEKALAAPARAPTVILLHYPLFMSSPDEGDSPRSVVDPASRQRLIRLAAKGGVEAIFSGHLHRTIEQRRGRVLFVTGPAVAYGSARDSRCQAWTLLTRGPDGTWTVEFRYVTDHRPAAARLPWKGRETGDGGASSRLSGSLA